MLLRTTKKRRLTALLALPACVLIGLHSHILPRHNLASPPNAAPVRASRQPQSLPEALAAARREGFAITAQDLQAPLPPPEQNAAPIYMQFASHSTGEPFPAFVVPEVSQDYQLTEAEIAALRKALADYANAEKVDAIHRATARPQCVFLRDWTQGAGVSFPEYAYIRAAGNVLAAESLLLLHDGKPLEAVRVQAMGFAIARHAAQEPIFIGYTAACAIQSLTLRGMQNILLKAGTDAAVANAVRQAVEQNRARFTPAHAMRGGLAMMFITLDDTRAKPFKEVQAMPYMQSLKNASDFKTYTDRLEFTSIQQSRRLVTAMEHSYPQAMAAVEAALPDPDPIPTQSGPYLPSTLVTAWPYRYAPALQARLRAQEESVGAAGALLVYRAAQGAFPDRLEAALAPAPADPFGTGSLGYRKEGAGFVLYSVGKTGKYDGKGEPDSANQETCLRYPHTTNAPK